MTAEAPRLRLRETRFYERDVVLRMPFRFGVVTLTEAPQTFLRVRVELADGRSGWGQAAEMLAPKWFDKDPALSNADNFDQLRRSLALAQDLYAAADETLSAFGLHAALYETHRENCAAQGLNPLIASFGTALLDRAILDALCRLEGLSVFEAVAGNLPGIDATTAPDLDGFDLPTFLARLGPRDWIHARHTVGLVDPITAADLDPADRVGDGLPETLEDCVRVYGNRYFKLKVGGAQAADLERLTEIAAVLDRIEAPYQVTLDGNEQYADVEAIAALWQAMAAAPALKRLVESTLFVEQPILRSEALSQDIGALSRFKPVEIDESDATMETFLQAKALGYSGVSSKSCKGLYRSLLNRARCALWNREAGEARYFMSAEDLTTQAGLCVQQDLALASLIGCDHVERNGHHYVNGMVGVPAHEQDAFLAAHGDLYHRAGDVVRLTITDGRIALNSLRCPGYACAVEPDWSAMTACEYRA